MPLAPRFGITSPVWGQSISDSARRNLFVSVRLRHGLFYKRGCQEHFSPSAGGASSVRGIQPLSTTKDAGIPGVVPRFSSSIFLVATTPLSS